MRYLILLIFLAAFSTFAKQKPTLAEIYKAKAEYDKASSELEIAKIKYGKDHPIIKQAEKKAKKAADQFYGIATIEYWEAMQESYSAEADRFMSDLKRTGQITFAVKYENAMKNYWQATARLFLKKWEQSTKQTRDCVDILKKRGVK